MNQQSDENSLNANQIVQVRFATKHSALIGLMFARKHEAAASRANRAHRPTRLRQDLLPSQKGKPPAW
jgi:hypothetical protein